ncbi:MAG: hypothetical protein KDK00_01860 [Rhodobacteraceae bacterium]|nr:hypothetical protein [Paracoccaceae bacterium]
MPLTLLLVFVVLGIAGIFLLIRALHPTPDLTFGDAAQASAIWDRQNPDMPARSLHIAPGGGHVLVETDAGPGLLWAFGADPVSRLFDTAPQLVDTGQGLTLITHDFTAPKVTIPLADPASRAAWAAILTGQEI